MTLVIIGIVTDPNIKLTSVFHAFVILPINPERYIVRTKFSSAITIITFGAISSTTTTKLPILTDCKREFCHFIHTKCRRRMNICAYMHVIPFPIAS
ncbi:MAG: hypothetical protein ACE5J5_04705 [Candidatus Hydrothermarchaeales archaeon]